VFAYYNWLAMKLTTCWEASRCSANQIASILCSQKFHCHVHRGPSLLHILSQINPVYTHSSCFFRIHFNIIHLRLDLNLDIVAYRPVAKSRLCKQKPLLWSARSLRVLVDVTQQGDVGGVFRRSAPRLYDSTDRVLLSEWVQCSWGFACGVLRQRATEAE
jgi:hypothetical protein